MNDDPSAVSFLYGIVQSDVLQQIADGILNRFVTSGRFSMILLRAFRSMILEYFI